MTNSPILTPVIILILWTFVMWIWMYITRIPAMQAAKIDLNPATYTKDELKKLPFSAQWKADNYNHLLELPPIFYAVAIILAIVGEGDGINLWLAWAFVSLRILHSLWQAILNIVMVRFALFAISTIILMWLTINAAMIIT
ncbi:hypothetical protein LPB140_07365 [Sphingorhabdus lutea]|uniref:MAPEG family protein n=1 Tax=Sphingorhabdus lutea TaxID=1913578 RepID=A0A1L3JBY5_9SPHN|nr:MAPEG family protein [Sphingorhabdus lutea]APG62636.1 hypothetical protein LPB140_07365 [Sphingorhabdus lutea]